MQLDGNVLDILTETQGDSEGKDFDRMGSQIPAVILFALKKHRNFYSEETRNDSCPETQCK